MAEENQAAADAAEKVVEVVLDAPGVKACGPYQRGTIYEVPESEANRLVEAKGFKRVTATMKKQIEKAQSETENGGA